MAVLLGLGAAFTYGTADFIGGLVTRRNPPTRVVFLSKAAGLLLYVAALPLLIRAEVTAGVLGWGPAAGLVGAAATAFLYRGLAHGRMGVVAPVSAVLSALIPVLFGLLIGERPSPLQMVGLAVGILAVILVSTVPEPPPRPPLRERLARSGVVDAVLAGVLIGAFLILITRAGEDSGPWPLVVSQTTEIAVTGLFAAATGTSVRADPGTGKGIATAGALGAGANLMYLVGTQLGLISVVAVLAGLYPGTTVLLARVFLGDRLARSQVIGLVLALAGVIMLAAG